MHFSASSAHVAVVLVLSILLSCVTGARRIHARSTAVGVSSNENSSPPHVFAAASDSPNAKKLSEVPNAAADVTTVVSYEVTDSSTIANAVDDDDFAEFNFDSDDTTEATGDQWIQKILQRRMHAKTQRSVVAPEDGASALKSPGNPLSLGQVLATVLYGPAWPTIHTNSKCSEDMRIYNMYLQNFTLWATKSKLYDYF